MDKRRKPQTSVRVFVHSRQGLGEETVDAAFKNGTAHNPRPYGFESAEQPGFALTYSKDSRETNFQVWLFHFLGFDIVHAFRNLRRFCRADITWTVLEWEWLALSLLQRLRLAPQRPIIGNSVWMMDKWPTWGRRYRIVWKWLMSPNVYLAMHSEAAAMRARSLLPDKDFHVVPFGISTLAFPPRTPRRWDATDRPIRIYAIGDDKTRDWITLLSAFGNDSRFSIRIICRWIDKVVNVGDFDNLEVPRDNSIAAQQSGYCWADVVVMPMVENVFSGITVVCEAVAMGVPVVCSETGGVPTYFSAGEVLYVKPSDPESLRDAVLATQAHDWAALANSASERFRRSDYSQTGMAARYQVITRQLLGTGAD